MQKVECLQENGSVQHGVLTAGEVCAKERRRFSVHEKSNAVNGTVHWWRRVKSASSSFSLFWAKALFVDEERGDM